jgi:small ligand-binding sensory domain FIST
MADLFSLLSSDIFFQIASFLNVQEGNRVSCVSRRWWYVIHHYRRMRGPEITTGASYSVDVKTRQQLAPGVIQAALNDLQGRPSLALGFNTLLCPSLYEYLPRVLPRDCLVLGSVSAAIQSSIQGVAECKSKATVMLGSFPQGNIHPFAVDDDQIQHVVSKGGSEAIVELIAAQINRDNDPNLQLKCILLYTCGYATSQIQNVIAGMQTIYPGTAIVGGISDGGYVSTPITPDFYDYITNNASSIPNDKLIQILKTMGDTTYSRSSSSITKATLVERFTELSQYREYYIRVFHDESQGAIFGVGLSGDVPVRPVISRGVDRITVSPFHTERPSPGNFVITESKLCMPGDPDYLFQGSRLPPYHIIYKILDQDKGMIVTPRQMTNMFGQSNFVGFRPEGQDGFELFNPHSISYNMEPMIMLELTHVKSLDGYHIDLFDLSSQSCLKDVETTMQNIKEQTQGEEILGALMFSCAGRGPNPSSFISEQMADASRFAKAFPDVPLLGFYANGEIGPTALACRQSVFQSNRACLQGFTAVFVFFIVPKNPHPPMEIDDSEDTIAAFLQAKLAAH